MALAAFLADRAIMRMIGHQPLDHAGAELHRLGIADRDARVLSGLGHACHDDTSVLVVFAVELFHRALAACADRSHRGVPAEIRDLEAQRKTSLEEICLLYTSDAADDL